jgi:hypothetical protein
MKKAVSLANQLTIDNLQLTVFIPAYYFFEFVSSF